MLPFARIVCLALAITITTAVRYEFEDGKNIGGTFDVKTGSIDYATPNTEVYLKVPRYTQVTYMHVVVDAETKPNVTFNRNTASVSINFDKYDVSKGTYAVTGKAVPFLRFRN